MIEEIKAQLQTQVSKFLALRQPLLVLTKSTNFEVSSKAKEYLNIQTKLELELKTVMDSVDAHEADGTSPSVSEGATYAIFYKDLSDHTRNAEAFVNSNGSLMKASGIPTWMYVAGGAVLLLLLTRR